jgi:hypothetical protein
MSLSFPILLSAVPLYAVDYTLKKNSLFRYYWIVLKFGLAIFATLALLIHQFADPASHKLSPPTAAPGDGNNRKHPAVAASANGQMLLVWTEGTGWSKGGSLGWQLFDNSGRPSGVQGHAPGIPVWGLPSAFADDQGNFTIVY